MAPDRIAAELCRRADAAMKVRRESTDDEERHAQLLKLEVALRQLLDWTKFGIAPAG